MFLEFFSLSHRAWRDCQCVNRREIPIDVRITRHLLLQSPLASTVPGDRTFNLYGKRHNNYILALTCFTMTKKLNLPCGLCLKCLLHLHRGKAAISSKLAQPIRGDPPPCQLPFGYLPGVLSRRSWWMQVTSSPVTPYEHGKSSLWGISPRGKRCMPLLYWMTLRAPPTWSIEIWPQSNIQNCPYSGS